jgi:hypothetical protein
MHYFLFRNDPPPFPQKNTKYYEKKPKKPQKPRTTRRNSPRSSLELDQQQIRIELVELYKMHYLLFRNEPPFPKKPLSIPKNSQKTLKNPKQPITIRPGVVSS